MNGVFAGILVYVLGQLALGYWVSRRVKTQADYLLAGRRLGPGVATLTIFATWFGAESCLGAGGEVYSHGLSGGSADPFGYVLCLVFLAVGFAGALWRRQLTTLADLFRQRWSPGVERLAAVIMIPTSVLWAGAQIRAFGQVLAASSDFPVEISITFAAAVVVIYTALGGLMADAITDVIQGGVLIIGLFVLGGAVIWHYGSLSDALATIEPERWRWTTPDQTFWDTVEAWALPICGSVVAQEVIVRVLASRSARVAKGATLGAAALYLTVGLMPVFIGLVAPSLLGELDHPDQVILVAAQRLLPGVFYLLFAGALVSAILSTVDSALLVASSLVSQNVIASIRPDLSDSALLRVSRIGVLAFGLVAYGLAMTHDSVHALVEQASGFGSAGVFVLLLMGLSPRFGGPPAAYGSLVAGVATYVTTTAQENPTPFLWSLLAAAGTYAVLGCVFRGWDGGASISRPAAL